MRQPQRAWAFRYQVATSDPSRRGGPCRTKIFAHSIAEKRRLRKNDRRQQQTVLPCLPHLTFSAAHLESKTHHHVFLRVAVTIILLAVFVFILQIRGPRALKLGNQVTASKPSGIFDVSSPSRGMLQAMTRSQTCLPSIKICSLPQGPVKRLVRVVWSLLDALRLATFQPSFKLRCSTGKGWACAMDHSTHL